VEEKPKESIALIKKTRIEEKPLPERSFAAAVRVSPICVIENLRDVPAPETPSVACQRN
jgi:hypothetical protein